MSSFACADGGGEGAVAAAEVVVSPEIQEQRLKFAGNTVTISFPEPNSIAFESRGVPASPLTSYVLGAKERKVVRVEQGKSRDCHDLIAWQDATIVSHRIDHNRDERGGFEVAMTRLLLDDNTMETNFTVTKMVDGSTCSCSMIHKRQA